MRHNQNGRRFRGRSGGNGQHQGGNGGGHSGGGVHHSGGNNQRRVNPRVQTFDSNGPDVRIRGNAYQINEKYLALARDATSAGDRVLAESYFQYAEHYQRLITEMNDEYNKSQPPQHQQHQNQHQPQQGQSQHHHQGGQPSYGPQDQQQPQSYGHSPDDGAGEQPSVEMSDLDQGFLIGPRNGTTATENVPAADGDAPPVRAARAGRGNFVRAKETGQV